MIDLLLINWLDLRIMIEWIVEENGDRSFTVLLKGPILIVKWTRLSLFQPSGYAVEVECMIARPPSHCALLSTALLLWRLAFDTDFHKMISADGAIVNLTLPLPHGNCVPFFDYKLLFLRVGINLHFLIHFIFYVLLDYYY